MRAFVQKNGELSATTTMYSPVNHRTFFQPKLTVNTPGDAHEQEADHVADQVMRMRSDEEPIAQRMPLTPVKGVQRKCTECEEKEKVQRAETGSGKTGGQSAPPIVSRVLSSGIGRPMDAGTRQFMENRFGQDFGQVRIHTGSQAAESAAAIKAKAYTSGRDIVFGAGAYTPETVEGKHLLAHELAHVQQQGEKVYRQVAQPEKTPVLCPDASGIIAVAKARTLGKIGYAYDKGPQAGWWYSPNGNLAGARSKPLKWEVQQGAKDPLPGSNFIVNWGDQYTCNLFVYDVLHQAGYNPPMGSNNHYYDARQTFDLSGGLKSYLVEITNHDLVCPGEIVATGIHMEIVASIIDASGRFQSYGAHSDGAYLSPRTAASTDKFFRLK